MRAGGGREGTTRVEVRVISIVWSRIAPNVAADEVCFSSIQVNPTSMTCCFVVCHGRSRESRRPIHGNSTTSRLCKEEEEEEEEGEEEGNDDDEERRKEGNKETRKEAGE